MGNILLSLPALLSIACGYLLGSIPFGLLLTRAAGLGDVRQIGSGNIGATNVLRTGSKGLAAATLLLDALKATAAVYIVHAVLKSRWGFSFNFNPDLSLGAPSAGVPQLAYQAFIISALAGVAAFVGHIYPVWLGFKGGKGVATFIGAALGFFWPAALLFCGVWLIFAFAFRFSSLAALAASAIATAYPFLIGHAFIGMLMLLMTVLIFYKHGANIRRLFAGEEPKIGQKD